MNDARHGGYLCCSSGDLEGSRIIERTTWRDVQLSGIAMTPMVQMVQFDEKLRQPPSALKAYAARIQMVKITLPLALFFLWEESSVGPETPVTAVLLLKCSPRVPAHNRQIHPHHRRLFPPTPALPSTATRRLSLRNPMVRWTACLWAVSHPAAWRITRSICSLNNVLPSANTRSSLRYF